MPDDPVAAYLAELAGELGDRADAAGLAALAQVLRLAALDAQALAGDELRWGAMRRKGELGRAGIDRGWPHQVRIVVPEGGLGNRLNAMHAAAAGIGDYKTRGDLRGAIDSVRFCFATRAHAAEFQQQFGGEAIDLSG